MKTKLSVQYRNEADDLIDFSWLWDTDIPNVGQVISPFRTLNGPVRWYVLRVLKFDFSETEPERVEIMITDLGHMLDIDFLMYDEFFDLYKDYL